MNEVLTPQQQAFENQLNCSPVIKKLVEADKEIINDLEGLKKGQETLGSFVKEGFEKGKVRFSGVEEEIGGLKRMFENHIGRQEQMHKETKDSIDSMKESLIDHKYQDLKEEKKKLQAKIDQTKENRFQLLKIVFSAIVSAAITGAVFFLTGK